MNPVKFKDKPKKRHQYERLIQISIFDWARMIRVPEGGHLYDFMVATPNGGSRNLLEAVNFKRSGVKAGFPDISILLPRGKWHGMFLEIKRDIKSKISGAQIMWCERLLDVGYYVEVGAGFEECLNIIESYLRNDQLLSDNGIQALQRRKKII